MILYELLTGAWPFGDPSSLMAELRRATGEATVTRPSAAVTEQAAETRALSRGRLTKVLSGDMAAIAGKALENEPARRYPAVRQLAEDIQRFLEGRAVEARAQTWAYRAGKFVRRRWLAAGARRCLSSGWRRRRRWPSGRRKWRAPRLCAPSRSTDFLTGMLGSAGEGRFDAKTYTVAQMLEQGGTSAWPPTGISVL